MKQRGPNTLPSTTPELSLAKLATLQPFFASFGCNMQCR